jgi:Domain of unknown function (DUF4116)
MLNREEIAVDSADIKKSLAFDLIHKIHKNGLLLEYASDELKADREYVLAAVRQNGWALQFASAALRADREVVLEGVRKDGRALYYASAALKADREVVLAAVRRNGYALPYVSYSLKADREVVLAAVRQNGNALECAHPDLRADEEVVLEAVKQWNGALIHADDSCKKNRNIAIEVFKFENNLPGWENTDKSLHQFGKAYTDLLFSFVYPFPKDRQLVCSARKILEQCATLFVNKSERINVLADVLNRTESLISNPSKENTQAYQKFTRHITKKPSYGMQQLGKLMMGLSILVAAASAVLAVTCGAIVPVAVACSAVGLFAAGAVLNRTAKKDNHELIEKMDELASKPSI